MTKSLKGKPQTTAQGRRCSIAHSLLPSQASRSDEYAGNWYY